MNPFLKIENRKIGLDFKPLVIAEIGINHGGSIDVAIEMVDAASKVGAEIIKHQTHIVYDEMSNEARKIKPGNADISIFDIMEKCALSEQDEIQLQDYVKSKRMIFISSPFSRAAADRLMKMNVPAFKIGSGECSNYPLLKHIAKAGKPIILSTGMNSIKNIKKSVEIFNNLNISVAILHCTNLYPTPPEFVRLGGLTELQKNFPDHVVGLSDHSITNIPSIGAIALGASIIERHFTDRMDRSGPDIICSMDQEKLSELLNDSQIIWKARGGKREPLKEEKVTIDFAFASVVTIKEIKKGDIFNEENLWVKRPNVGEISAEEYENIIGLSANKDLPKDYHLRKLDINYEK